MFHRPMFKIVCTSILAAMLLTACAPAATPAPATQAPVETTAPTAAEASPAETAPAEGQPTELHMAALLSSTTDNPWDQSFLLSYQRVQEKPPHGLKLADLDFTEGVYGDEAENVLREYAATGKYDIIWAHSAYTDQIKKLKDEYPEVLFVVTGSGNEALGGNVYWLFLHIHEPAFLMGRYAGALTKTDVIGMIAGYETDDTLDVFNGFLDGALSVNPDVKAKVSFIESWYDPAKAAEAANAQIAAGADQIYQNSYGFEPCIEKDVYCYSTYTDLNFLAPENVLTSALAFWDPHVVYAIDEWWKHKTEGTPYNAPMEVVWFNMAEGTGDIAPLHGLEAEVPESVQADVMKARDDILSGDLKVELKVAPIESQ